MKKLEFRWIVCLAVMAGSSGPILSADWPTFRGDVHRSGYSPEELPGSLSLRWMWAARHAPRPAWSGRDTRMPFDRAFRLAVAGGTAVFGSSADDKIYALDAATGAEKWTFITGGPIRLAPSIWKGRVLATSDDGYLYCLDLNSGQLQWKLRGGPSESFVLGNGRMVSRWPARGGAAVLDGVAYFAAGIWPSEGIYLYAVDVESGKVLWCNESSGSLYLPQPHGGANAKSGVSAQGHLAVAGDLLLVPTGRAVPAAFRRSDGKFLYFHLQKYGNKKGGGSALASRENHFFSGGFPFHAKSGDLAGKQIGTPVVAVTTQSIIHVSGKEIVEREWTETTGPDRKGKDATKTVLGDPVFQVEAPHPVDSLLATSNAVLLGTEGRLTALDRRTKKAILSMEVAGNPLELAVSEGRLYASTDVGTIYCFDGSGPEEPKILEPPEEAPPEIPETFLAAAEEIIRKGNIREGYCVDLACGDGSLACALARRTELQIYAVDPDPKNVALARERLDRAGLYGTGVTVHLGDPASTSYPNSFANLVVSSRTVTEGSGGAPGEEIRRLQRPYGGVACLGRPGSLEVTVRGGLEGAGTWTHQYSNPANTNCSGDTIVRGPLGMLWFTDLNFPMPSRHGRGPAPLFLEGRLFVEGLDALRAVDAYNGRTLWEHPLPGILKAYDQEHLMGTAGTGSNVCVGESGVYVAIGGSCLQIDAATGKLIKKLGAPPRPDGEAGTWGAIALADGILFGTLADTSHIVKWRFGKSDMETQFTESILLFALDVESGEVKWTYRPQHSIRHNAMAIGGGRIFLIDRPLARGDRLDGAAKTTEKKSKGEAGKKSPGHPEGMLLALSAKSGRPAWNVTKDIYGTLLALSEKHGVLLMAYQHTRFQLDSEIGGRMAAFRASDGKRLWDIQANYDSRPVLNGRTIYAQPGSWDLLTGAKNDFQFKRSYGCGILAASKNLMVFRSATLGYLDLTCREGTENYGGIRPGCWINAIPAGGLVLMPDATERCTCSYLIKSSIALQPYGLRPPKISPEGGASPRPIRVKLECDSGGTDIRYTLDGSTPSAESKHYGTSIQISETSTLKARAFRKGLPPSPVSSASFVIDPRLIPLEGSAWSVLDSPGAKPPRSEWKVSGGVAEELSNHFLGSAENADPATERPGTLRIYKPGGNFSDGWLELELSSSDDDTLGVAFRLQGQDRFYLWAMDKQRGFHSLALKSGTGYRLLASNSESYEPNRWYRLEVALQGPKITVYLDGEKDLEATDPTFKKGTFALYAWGCAGAKFRSLRWVSR